MKYSAPALAITSALTLLLGGSIVFAQQASVTPVFVATPEMPTPLEQAPKKPEVIDEFKTTSIMFDAADISRVNKIIDAFLSGVRNDEPEQTDKVDKEDVLTEILSQLDGKDTKVAPKAHVLPSFYLSSIVYYSANDWAVWINGFKITNRNNKKEPPLYVESISKYQATLVWQPAKLILSDVRQIGAKNKDREDAHALDPLPGTVTFTLRPNQTFVSGIMAIKEGKVESITLPTKVGNQLAGEQSANPDATSPDGSPTNGQLPPGMQNSIPGTPGMPPGGMLPPGAGQPGMMPPGGRQPTYQGIKSSIDSELVKGIAQQ